MRPIGGKTMRLVVIVAVEALLCLWGCHGADPTGGTQRYQPKPGTNEIDMVQVRSLVPGYRQKTDEQIDAGLNDDDYNRRGAASYVRLERAHIPVAADGVRVIESEYLSDPSRRTYGFSLLGNLAALDIAK